MRKWSSIFVLLRVCVMTFLLSPFTLLAVYELTDFPLTEIAAYLQFINALMLGLCLSISFEIYLSRKSRGAD